MNVVYSDQAKQWGEGFALLHQATERLKDVLGPSQDTVKVEWDRREDDQSRPLYTVKLSDGSEEAEAMFAPDELTHSTHMRVRLYRLWGNLLQARNRRQMRELQEAGNVED